MSGSVGVFGIKYATHQYLLWRPLCSPRQNERGNKASGHILQSKGDATCVWGLFIHIISQGSQSLLLLRPRVMLPRWMQSGDHLDGGVRGLRQVLRLKMAFFL